jgi:uncharacterized protein with HEPN domain
VNEARVIDYLGHMLEAVQLASSYIEGLDEDGFLADRRTQQAVILNIVVIGEAATKLASEAPELVERNPDVPWKGMRGMRNRMAHGYFDVDLTIVWQTVQSSLPALAERLTAIRDELADRQRQTGGGG